jgi:hypothetical protein
MPTLPTFVVVPVQRSNSCSVCPLRSDGTCRLFGTTVEAQECRACSTRLDHLLTLLAHFCEGHPGGLSRAETDQLCTAYHGLKTSLDALRLQKEP